MDPMDLLAFKVVIEPDEDLWQSYYPAWEHLGAATFGNTPEEAAANIKEVLEMIVEEIEEGEIEWPVEPCAGWEFSKPSVQDTPELLSLECAPEYPDAIASHGGLPVDGLSDFSPNDVYRLIYVAMDDVLAAIYARDTFQTARTGGYISTIFAPYHRRALGHETHSQYGYVSRGAQIRLERVRNRSSTQNSDPPK